MLSLLYLGVKDRQYFVRSSCLFLGKKTLLKIWLNSGLNVTNFRGTGSHFPPIWPQMRTRKGSVAPALSKANFVSRNIGLKQISLCRIASLVFSIKARKNQSVLFTRWVDIYIQRILLKWIGSSWCMWFISSLFTKFFSHFLRPTLPGDKTCQLQLPTTKTSLLKWIRAASNFIALSPSRSIRQFLAKCFGVEFQSTVSKFRKRKRKLLPCVPGLDKWGGRGGTRVGGVTRLSILSLILIWSRLHVRWGDPPHVTSPTWGPPPTCTQALRRFHVVVGRQRRQRNVPKSVMHVQSELLFS